VGILDKYEDNNNNNSNNTLISKELDSVPKYHQFEPT
jgi:hypothetical protein